MAEGASLTLQQCPLCCKALQQPQLIQLNICRAPYTFCGALHLRNLHFKQGERQGLGKQDLLVSQHLIIHLNVTQNESVPITKVPRTEMVYHCFSHYSLFPSSPRRTLLCWRQERQLASTVVQSQLGKAPGIHPPQKTTAARALHIKNPPTHKAQH